MKNIYGALLLLFCFLLSNLSMAQNYEIVGLGNYYSGSIISISPENQEITSQFSFSPIDGITIDLGKLLEVNGEFWGATRGGGKHGFGVIYKINSSNEYVKIYDFTGETAIVPATSLVYHESRIWGTAISTTSDKGLIFSIATDGSSFRIESDFSSIDTGITTEKGLTSYDGSLWGFTYPSEKDPAVLWKYDDGELEHISDLPSEIGNPASIPVFFNGFLYGLSPVDSSGKVWKLKADGSEFEIIHNFSTFEKGGLPFDLQVIDGKLLGASITGGENSGGTLFEVDKATDEVSVFFHGELHNEESISGFMQVPVLYNGRLWGAALQGVYYSMNPDGTDPKVEYVTTDIEGRTFNGPITLVEGNIYCVSAYSGELNLGSLHKFDLDNSELEVIHAFDSENEITDPQALIEYKNRLIGVSRGGRGGTTTSGALFEISEEFSKIDIIEDFSNLDFSGPYGTLVNLNGKVWGITSWGGENDLGVIFSYDGQGNFVKQYNFDASAEGLASGLIAWNNSIYGVGQYGPKEGFLYEYNTINNEFDNIYNFDFVGESRSARPHYITLDDNTIYGTIESTSVHAKGIIYKYDLENETFQILHTFEEANTPSSKLIKVEDRFIGTTKEGGSNDAGTIYSISADGSGFSIIYDFSGNGGEEEPAGNLLISGGKIWGATPYGGKYRGGVLYNINPDGTNFNVITQLSANNGGDMVALSKISTTYFGTPLSHSPRKANISLSPNPASSAVRINTSGKKIKELRVYDINGRKKDLKWIPEMNILSVNTLSNGLYFVEILLEGPSDTSQVFKLLKH